MNGLYTAIAVLCLWSYRRRPIETGAETRRVPHLHHGQGANASWRCR